MTYFRTHTDADGLLHVIMDDPSGSTNRTTDLFKAELDALLTLIETAPAEDRPKGIILSSAKTSFGVGGDIGQIMAYASIGPQSIFADSERIKALFRRIETCGVPFAACIAGTAAGGGFELALACHSAFVLDDQTIRLGLPEVTLGLVPGAGGLLRLIHRIGFDKALPLIAEGQFLSPQAATALGLVTELAADHEALLAAAKYWLLAHPQAKQPWDIKGHRVPGGTLFSSPYRYLSLQARTAHLIRAGKGHKQAPLLALSTMAEIAQAGFADGGKIESRTFARLAASRETRCEIGLSFLDKQTLRRAPSRPAGLAKSKAIQRAGVVGAGLMGAGIAYANAKAGIDVLIADRSLDAAQSAMTRIREAAEGALRRGEIAADAVEPLLARITPVAMPEELTGCDLIIEAVFEDIALKKDLLRKLEALLGPQGLLASNTSALSISQLAENLNDPNRFIGLHFFSPVERMELIEIVVGTRTSEATLAKGHDYARQLGKTPIVIADSHGFFASRVFQKFIYEAAALIDEGTPAALIENAALQAGYPAGPLALLDDTSLGLSIKVIEGARKANARNGLPPENHAGEWVIEALVKDFDRPGRSAGKGFYDYADTGKSLWPGLSALATRKAAAIPTREAIAERFLYGQCADVLRCAAEGIIRSAAEINTGAVKAIGFPAWTGGPLRFIAETGLDAFVARAKALTARHGPRFALPVADSAALSTLLAKLSAFDTPHKDNPR